MKNIEFFLKSFKNKKVLVVFPHPDDESVMTGGLVQRMQSMGMAVTVLSLTEGENGKIHVNGRGRSLREIRTGEFAKAMGILKVSDWVMWSFDDGKLRIKQGWRKRLRLFINQNNYDLVVSYDLSGVSGHPDHISLSRELLSLLREYKFQLLWVSFLGHMKNLVVNPKVEKYLQEPEFELNLSLRESFRKWQAVFSHRSQALQGFLHYPWWILIFVSRCEWYTLVVKKSKYRYRHITFGM
jgi:LmbE family N-acetylglucosaminyl deacetylase